jgi:hypothetical protein
MSETSDVSTGENPGITKNESEQSPGLTPDVLFLDDVGRILRASSSTIERRRRAGSFPIPELPSIDGRPRWSRQAVERYLSSTSAGLRHRQQGRRR